MITIFSYKDLEGLQETRDPAALLRAGDRVRFVSIGREEFEAWDK